MNWIILIIAGLFEVAFAFCLGKARETTGNETSISTFSGNGGVKGKYYFYKKFQPIDT